MISEKVKEQLKYKNTLLQILKYFLPYCAVTLLAFD